MKKSKIPFTLQFSVIIFLVIQPFFTQAQNFVSGFVISHAGDTVHCQINDKEWDKSPTEIEVKTKGGNIENYSPHDIKAFYVKKGELYESHEVTYDITTLNINKLDYETKEELVTGTIFLRVEVQGPITLYYNKDQTRKKHLFLTTPSVSTPYELNYKKRYEKFKVSSSSQAGALRLVTEKTYIKQLKAALNACPNLSQNIEDLAYSLKGIKKVVQEYYRCQGVQSKPKFVSPADKKFDVRPTLTVGWGQTGLKTGGELSRWMDDFEPGISSSITAGGGVEFVFLKRRKQMSFILEFLYRKNQYTQAIDEPVSTSIVYLGNRNVTLEYLRIYAMFRHTLPMKKIKPFYQFGFANGAALSYVNDAHYDQISTSGHIISNEEQVIQSLRKFEQGWALGIGLQFYGKAEFELRIERGNGFTWSSNYYIKTRSYFILGRYRF